MKFKTPDFLSVDWFNYNITRFERDIIKIDILNSNDLQRLRSIETLFEMPREDASRLFSPYFVKYHARLFREKGFLNCIVDYVRWWSSLLQIEGKEILDAGCGFGVYTIIFSFFQAKHVHGIDHNKEKINLFNKLLSVVKPEINNVTSSLADGLTLDFSDGQFQAIFIKDVISHVRKLDPFIEEMARLLAPGGRIIITDENNALEWAGKRERRKKWLAWEVKGVNPEDLRADEPHMTYFEMRREDIDKYLTGKDISGILGLKGIPRYSESEENRSKLINMLTRLTQGLWGDELIEGVTQIIETGELKIKPEFPYRHPRTGEFMEREFNPFTLARYMHEFGLKSHVIPARYYTQKTFRNALGKIITITHPLSVFIQPNFYILGIKK